MAPRRPPPPGTRPTAPKEATVDKDILRQRSYPEKVPAPTHETPHGCYEGWVYLGFEGEDQDG
jgi:hypothetical protein